VDEDAMRMKARGRVGRGRFGAVRGPASATVRFQEFARFSEASTDLIPGLV